MKLALLALIEITQRIYSGRKVNVSVLSLDGRQTGLFTLRAGKSIESAGSHGDEGLRAM